MMNVLSLEPHDAEREARVTPWVGFLLNQTAQRVRTMTAASLEPTGLTPPLLRVLETLADGQPLSQVRLGERVGMDRTTIVQAVDRLERLGVARRTQDPNDRRSNALALTVAGDRVLADAQNRARAAQDAFLSPLGSAERAMLFSLLSTLHQSTSPCPQETRR